VVKLYNVFSINNKHVMLHTLMTPQVENHCLQARFGSLHSPRSHTTLRFGLKSMIFIQIINFTRCPHKITMMALYETWNADTCSIVYMIHILISIILNFKSVVGYMIISINLIKKPSTHFSL